MKLPTETYCLDTSSLMNPWKKLYQPDMFGSIWEEHIPMLILMGNVVSSRQVLIEILRQDDDLAEWCKEHEPMFEEVDDACAAHVTMLMEKYDLLTKAGRNEADPFVVARALAGTPSRRLVVVSEEGGGKPAPKKQNIPFICEQSGVRCITFNGFLRETGWRERVKGGK